MQKLSSLPILFVSRGATVYACLIATAPIRASHVTHIQRGSVNEDDHDIYTWCMDVCMSVSSFVIAGVTVDVRISLSLSQWLGVVVVVGIATTNTANANMTKDGSCVCVIVPVPIIATAQLVGWSVV